MLRRQKDQCNDLIRKLNLILNDLSQVGLKCWRFVCIHMADVFIVQISPQRTMSTHTRLHDQLQIPNLRNVFSVVKVCLKSYSQTNCWLTWHSHKQPSCLPYFLGHSELTGFLAARIHKYLQFEFWILEIRERERQKIYYLFGAFGNLFVLLIQIHGDFMESELIDSNDIHTPTL